MACIKCPKCGRSVPTSKTDTINIMPESFHGYTIHIQRVRTCHCPCGAVGRTPVFFGETIWSGIEKGSLAQP